MDKMNNRELMSALSDGQLRGGAFAQAVEAAASDPAAREAWATYNLIGDVLRSRQIAVGSDPGAFVRRLQGRIALEPGRVTPSLPPASVAPGSTAREPANDASFRWKLVAGLASIAAVAAVGWSGVSSLRSAPGPQLAVLPSPTLAATATDSSGPMIRDPQLDELLATHRQFGGPSAFQMPAGALRNATFEAPAR